MILVGTRTEFLNVLRTLSRSPEAPEEALRTLLQCFGGEARDKLDRLVALADRRAAAQIDAGACRTAYDFRLARKAEERLEDYLAELFEEPACADPFRPHAEVLPGHAEVLPHRRGPLTKMPAIMVVEDHAGLLDRIPGALWISDR